MSVTFAREFHSNKQVFLQENLHPGSSWEVQILQNLDPTLFRHR